MKFDYVIGNPPYQENLENTSDKPVYNFFMDNAYKVADKVELITPARFLFNAGKTPKVWNERMLLDNHFKVLYYEPESSKVFANTDIKGGVVIHFRNSKKTFGAVEMFIPNQVVNSIFRKVCKEQNFKSIYEIVISSFSYRFSDKLYKDFPKLLGKQSKGHDFDITSNVFERMPEIFFDQKPKDSEKYISLFGRENNTRVTKFIKACYVVEVKNLFKYKIMIPKASGTGAFGETIATPVVVEPAVGSTQSFISIGLFESKTECNNALKYIKTKFSRTLLSIKKITQDITPEKWKYVPLQDFTNDSDIDWSKSVADIDKQLYAKYGLTDEEIAFIEKNVKEMA